MPDETEPVIDMGYLSLPAEVQEAIERPALTVVLASLPGQWRAEAKSSGPFYGAALCDCARELDEVLSISPRGCWEHPGVVGYQHPECGFCWHGKDGLDVPATGSGAAREPVCPRCQPPMPSGQVLVSQQDLRDALTMLALHAPLLVKTSGVVDRLAAAAGDV